MQRNVSITTAKQPITEHSHNYYFLYKVMVVFKAKSDHNIHSYAANCTIFFPKKNIATYTPKSPSICAVNICAHTYVDRLNQIYRKWSFCILNFLKNIHQNPLIVTCFQKFLHELNTSTPYQTVIFFFYI